MFPFRQTSPKACRRAVGGTEKFLCKPILPDNKKKNIIFLRVRYHVSCFVCNFPNFSFHNHARGNDFPPHRFPSLRSLAHGTSDYIGLQSSGKTTAHYKAAHWAENSSTPHAPVTIRACPHTHTYTPAYITSTPPRGNRGVGLPPSAKDVNASPYWHIM